jgi:uncharacterized protein (UPF0335 family)
MAQRVDLNKNVFNKADFLKTVDASFKQLVPPPVEEAPAFTIEDFFVEYENLFFEIPKEGETNSHRYLAQRSGEYANFDLVNQEIQALLDEIALLRQENVDLQQQVFDLQIELYTPSQEVKTAKKVLNIRDKQNLGQ